MLARDRYGIKPLDYVRRTLFHSDARIIAFLDRKRVQAPIAEHLEGKTNRRLLIWLLLYLEEWCRLFLERAAWREPPAGIRERLDDRATLPSRQTMKTDT